MLHKHHGLQCVEVVHPVVLVGVEEERKREREREGEREGGEGGGEGGGRGRGRGRGRERGESHKECVYVWEGGGGKSYSKESRKMCVLGEEDRKK